jgi:hypothetical protein
VRRLDVCTVFLLPFVHSSPDSHSEIKWKFHSQILDLCVWLTWEWTTNFSPVLQRNEKKQFPSGVYICTYIPGAVCQSVTVISPHKMRAREKVKSFRKESLRTV